jgi:dynein heavy chain
MKKVFTKRLVKANCSTARLQDFIKYNQAMEKIVKNLDVFLEEKRSEFPRFYFISNDELLQLLAH